MSLAATLLPVFVQVFLAFALLLALGAVRAKAFKAGSISLPQVSLTNAAWPDYALKVGNSFQNQFEIPIFFYFLTALALITQQNDFLYVALSWVFVASRIAHAFIHTTSNFIPLRFSMFSLGVGSLFLMWTLFALKILFPLT